MLILGDSITWGIGVRDWRHIYPNLLLNHLDQGGGGRRFDMEVFAYGGKNIDGHARAVQASAESLAPDYIIYQWLTTTSRSTSRAHAAVSGGNSGSAMHGSPGIAGCAG